MMKLFVVAAMVAIALCACPDGWTKYQDKCFFLSRDNATMADALVLCQTLGRMYGRPASLATIENSATQNAVEKLLGALRGGAWIGAVDIVKEGNFTWVSNGTPMTYAEWGPMQPNNRYGNENCMAIYNSPSEGYNYAWADELCTENYVYLCEMVAASLG